MDTTAPQIITSLPSFHPKGDSMHERVKDLLKQIGPGRMSNVAYDTAWVARLGEIDRELGQRALAWLSEHQLPDGSWGAQQPFYYHDRLMSTLAAMIALTYRGRSSQDHAQIERGLLALEAITDSATQRLHSYSNGATVGFEMIVPTLVAEAESLEIIKQQGERILGRLAQKRASKLSHIKGRTINKYVTVAFSAEMAGTDGQHMLDIYNLQEENGSVGHSPSATSYFALQVNPAELTALKYIREVISPDGGTPNVAPFDIFEVGWTLWNLSLIPGFTNRVKDIQTYLDFLSDNWKAGKGVGFASKYSVKDSDDSGLVFETLSRYGIHKDIDVILRYEENDRFRCYELEADASISANIHVLGALKQAGFENNHPSVQKILKFLETKKVGRQYWIDKWHISPYYATAHAIIACAGFTDEIVHPAVEWILRTQNLNGSWGYQFPSAEETAYCIQALEIWRQYNGNVPKEATKKAVAWLQENSEPPYPPLWIGKGLYAPELVVRSAILSALLISEEG